MNRYYQNSIGTAIVDFNTGDLLGLVKDFIINSSNGLIEGLWIKPLFATNADYLVLQKSSIIKWGKSIHIKNESEMGEPEDFLKLRSTLEKNILIIGNRVKNKEGSLIGLVQDLIFNDQTLKVKKILVQKQFLIFKWSTRIIGANEIIEIKKDCIIINDQNKEALSLPEKEELIASKMI